MADISLDDEEKVLRFLQRAGTAILASGWDAPSLGVLDMYAKDDEGKEVNSKWRDERPELAAIADEFYGPGEFDGDAKTLAEAYRAMLDANEEHKVPVHFRTFAHEETQNWKLDGTPLAKFMPFPIFGLYMIREGDPYRYGEFLENIFCYPRLPDDAPKNKYGQDELEAFFDGGEGAELEHNGEGWERVHYADPDEMDADPRFSERITFEVPVTDLVFTHEVMEALSDLDRWHGAENARDAIRDNLAEQATEGAREYLQGNAYHPKVVLAA